MENSKDSKNFVLKGRGIGTGDLLENSHLYIDSEYRACSLFITSTKKVCKFFRTQGCRVSKSGVEKGFVNEPRTLRDVHDKERGCHE